jgi:hypothetical protein
MKIKTSLPHFENSKALIVVTGKAGASFFLASDGIIHTLEKIEVKKRDPATVPHKFETRTSGMIVSGADEEKIKYEVRTFLKEFEKHFPRILKSVQPNQIYLFSPSYIDKEITKRIPKAKRNLIIKHFSGNYSDKHPFDLLTMIQKSVKDKKIVPMSSEAQKLRGMPSRRSKAQ